MGLQQDNWAEQLAGNGCYLCEPLRSASIGEIKIASLSISSLYLVRNQRFRGYSTLIFDSFHATGLDGLSDSDYRKYMDDLRRCIQALRQVFTPDHLNIELLGNSCPHLHWGIVPRYRSDPSWGRPIWEGQTRDELRLNPVVLSELELAQTILAVRTQL